MIKKFTSRICGTGSYLPDNQVDTTKIAEKLGLGNEIVDLINEQ